MDIFHSYFTITKNIFSFYSFLYLKQFLKKELLKVALIGVGSVGKKYARMITAGEVPHMKLSAVVIRKIRVVMFLGNVVNTVSYASLIFCSA